MSDTLLAHYIILTLCCYHVKRSVSGVGWYFVPQMSQQIYHFNNSLSACISTGSTPGPTRETREVS